MADNREVVKVGSLLPNLYYNPQPEYVSKKVTPRHVGVVDFTEPLKKMDTLAAGLTSGTSVGMDKLRQDNELVNSSLTGYNEKLNQPTKITSFVDLYQSAQKQKEAQMKFEQDKADRNTLLGSAAYNRENYEKNWGLEGANKKAKVDPTKYDAFQFKDNYEYKIQGGAYVNGTARNQVWTNLQDDINDVKLMDDLAQNFKANGHKWSHGGYNEFQQMSDGMLYKKKSSGGEWERVTENDIAEFTQFAMDNDETIKKQLTSDAQKDLFNEAKTRFGIDGTLEFDHPKAADVHAYMTDPNNITKKINEKINQSMKQFGTKYGYEKTAEMSDEDLKKVDDAYLKALAEGKAKAELEMAPTVYSSTGSIPTKNEALTGDYEPSVNIKANVKVAEMGVTNEMAKVLNTMDTNPAYTNAMTPQQRAEFSDLKKRILAEGMSGKLSDETQSAIDKLYTSVLRNPNITNEAKQELNTHVINAQQKVYMMKGLDDDATNYAQSQVTRNVQTENKVLLDQLKNYKAKLDAIPADKRNESHATMMKVVDEAIKQGNLGADVAQQIYASFSGNPASVVNQLKNMGQSVSDALPLMAGFQNYQNYQNKIQQEKNKYLNDRKDNISVVGKQTFVQWDEDGNVDPVKTEAARKHILTQIESQATHAKVHLSSEDIKKLESALENSNSLENKVMYGETIQKLKNGEFVDYGQIKGVIEGLTKHPTKEGGIGGDTKVSKNVYLGTQAIPGFGEFVGVELNGIDVNISHGKGQNQVTWDGADNYHNHPITKLNKIISEHATMSANPKAYVLVNGQAYEVKIPKQYKIDGNDAETTVNINGTTHTMKVFKEMIMYNKAKVLNEAEYKSSIQGGSTLSYTPENINANQIN